MCSTRLPNNSIPKPHTRISLSSGFTLIELIMVVVILGVLAAVAIPKFVDLGRNARLASIATLNGAIFSVAQMAFSKCSAIPACSTNARGAWAGGVVSNTTIVVAGTSYYLHFGYPIIWTNAGDGANLVGLLTLSGFTVQPYLGGSYSRDFTIDSAPSPLSCKVTYSFPNGYNQIAVVSTTSGC
jgi:MSHA pilin protein MshA